MRGDTNQGITNVIVEYKVNAQNAQLVINKMENPQSIRTIILDVHNNSIEIDVAQLPLGVYLVKLIADNLMVDKEKMVIFR